MMEDEMKTEMENERETWRLKILHDPKYHDHPKS